MCLLRILAQPHYLVGPGLGIVAVRLTDSALLHDKKHLWNKASRETVVKLENSQVLTIVRSVFLPDSQPVS